MIILVLVGLGLCLGSFVNALVWRLRQQLNDEGQPRKLSAKKRHQLSIMRGRSMCPHCEHQLSAKDLLPVVSWVYVRGRCRYCAKPISWQYPLVELLTALLFVLSYVFWPLSWDAQGMLEFVLWLPLLAGLIALCIYDIKWLLLPNRVVYTLFGFVGGWVGMRIFVFDGGLDAVYSALWGLMLGGGLFYAIFTVSSGKWIGGGDVKLGWLLGLLVGGPLPSMLLLFIASLLGTLTSVPLLVSGRMSRKAPMPFGPFLIGAAFIVQIFGASMIAWYKRQLGL